MELFGISLVEYVEFVKNHPILSVLWVGCFGYVIWSQILIIKDKIKFIDFDYAVIEISRNGGAFVDIRKPEEFKAEHIHGALDIDSAQILNGKFSRLEKFKNNLIVIVSHTNDDILAYNCAKALKKDGYKNTFLLRGGMLDLQSKCIPLSKK